MDGLKHFLPVLYVLLLLGVSFAVQGAVTGTAAVMGVRKVPSAPPVTQPAGAAPQVVAGAPGATMKTLLLNAPEQSQAKARETKVGVAAASSQDLVYDRRGLWITDGDRLESRVDRGPVPRQSVLLPVLMYHHVQPIDFSTSNAFVSDLTLPPTQFEQQLRYLRDRGFKSVKMEDLYLFLQGRRDLSPLSVILTFDDGYLDSYQYAYPLLVRYGFTGTFFIITGLVGQKSYMTWAQLKEMVAGKMEIGSHTINHPDLAHLSATQLDRELNGSKRVLEDTLGVAVRALSYPSGSYNQNVVVAAQKAGYVAAVTTRYGAMQQGAKALEMPRVRIHGTYTLPTFRWAIEQYFPVGGPETK